MLCLLFPQCDVCKRISKDSIAYLDHINSRQRKIPFIRASYRIQDTNADVHFLSFSSFRCSTLYLFTSFILICCIIPRIIDLRRLGQTTQVARSSLDQVRARIASLRAQTLLASQSKQFDFEARLKEVHQVEEERRVTEREKRIRERAEKREKERKERIGVLEQGGEEVMAGMGFGGFGSNKLKR